VDAVLELRPSLAVAAAAQLADAAERQRPEIAGAVGEELDEIERRAGLEDDAAGRVVRGADEPLPQERRPVRIRVRDERLEIEELAAVLQRIEGLDAFVFEVLSR